MSRITPDDVREILDTDMGEVSLQAFIEDAHRVVNDRCAPHTHDRDALASVETYLAAHLATTKDPRVSAVDHESVSIEYADEGDGQQYWHKAIMVDPTGRLARPSKGYPIYTT